jgi:NAD-dependent dihydropyrimidine dehydrogenase PreA subunit
MPPSSYCRCPAASRTVVTQFGDAHRLARASRGSRTPISNRLAFDVHVIVPRGEFWLLVRFATSPAADGAGSRPRLRAAAKRPPTGVLSDTDEDKLWRDHRQDIWKPDGVVVRRQLAAGVARQVLSSVQRIAQDTSASLELSARAGVGAGFVRIDGDDPSQTLRNRAAPRSPRHREQRGRASRRAAAVKQQVDVWGRSAQLDPAVPIAEADFRSAADPQRQWSDLTCRRTTPFSGSRHSVARLIDACVHCGFCLPTCPTYVIWGEEMDSPRGRIYLMKAGLEGAPR